MFAGNKMRQRRETVEHPFGTIKARMGAMHFLMKTLPRVASEMALHVLAVQSRPRREHHGRKNEAPSLGRREDVLRNLLRSPNWLLGSPERVLAWGPCAAPPGADRTAPASKGRSWLGVNIVKLPSLLRQQ